LANLSEFLVGDQAEGSLEIESAGTVFTAPSSGTLGAIIASSTSASGSSVNVSGVGSNWEVSATLIVAGGGSGALSLSQGASVMVGALDVAAMATGNGNVSLAGAGTTLNVTGSLTLGDQAAGELSILGGAQMTIAGGMVGGNRRRQRQSRHRGRR
jgi:T5SS/PEP-CTERM-associated repeat protein